MGGSRLRQWNGGT